MKVVEQTFLGTPKNNLVSERGQFLVSLSDLIMLEADSNYTLLHLSNGKKMMISRTMKYFEDLLENQGFYRVHNSYMINLSCLGNYEKKEGFLWLQNGFQVEVARRRRAQFEREVLRAA